MRITDDDMRKRGALERNLGTQQSFQEKCQTQNIQDVGCKKKGIEQKTNAKMVEKFKVTEVNS